MSFPRGTTPTFILTIPNGSEAFNEVENITVSICSKFNEIVKTGNDVTVISATEIMVTLTQEESFTLAGKEAEIMVNWTYPGTQLRWGTDVANVAVDKQLHMKVIR